MTRRPRHCQHPTCNKTTYRKWCGRHWFELPPQLRKHYIAARSREAKDEIELQALAFFRSRMVGRHEVVTCRGKDCDAPLVWLLARTGSAMPVEAASVEPGDDLYDAKKHIAHSGNCPNAKEFRDA